MGSVCAVITKLDFNCLGQPPLACFSVGGVQPDNFINPLQEIRLFVIKIFN
jgi:hypothetical protein